MVDIRRRHEDPRPSRGWDGDTTTHLAFAVDDLDAALEGKEILIPPNSPSPGVRVAFILDDGAPIELLELEPRDRD
jgi:hypothetical protein